MADNNKLEDCSDYINHIWKKYLERINWKSKDKHIFINDMERVDDITKDDEVFINNKFKADPMNIDEYFHCHECNFVPKEILSEKKVNHLFNYITKRETIPEWDYLEKELTSFSNYLLYSNIDLKSYQKKLKNKGNDTINVLILGAGPTGLFIANYLNRINLISPNTNLLVLDNRIIETNKGLRLPYTRNRIFAINFSIFSEFAENIPCIKEIVKQDKIEIRYLENLLIVLTYGNNIPIYFTDEVLNQQHLENFCQNNKIDVVFDCTGNRLKTDYFPDRIPKNFFPKDMIFENRDHEVVIRNNEAKLNWKDNMKNKYYVYLDTYNKDGKLIDSDPYPTNIVFEEDLQFFKQVKDKYIKIRKSQIDDIMGFLEKNIKDLRLLKDLQNRILDSANRIIKFVLVEIQIYHKLKISAVIKQNNQNTLYIGTGDTIFSSSWIIGAGLNRLLYFIKKPIWSLQLLSNNV